MRGSLHHAASKRYAAGLVCSGHVRRTCNEEIERSTPGFHPRHVTKFGTDQTAVTLWGITAAGHHRTALRRTGRHIMWPRVKDSETVYISWICLTTLSRNYTILVCLAVSSVTAYV